MTALPFNLVTFDGEEVLTFLVNGDAYVAAGNHPKFDEILAAVRAGDESATDLLDVANAIANVIADEQLSERLRAANGRITFDNDPLDGALEQTIIRYLESDDRANLAPLVRFVEKVMTNPVEHSREQAYGWIAQQSFSITDDGNLLAYKGYKPVDGGGFRSTHNGDAIVNGERQDSPVYQIGDLVELPRSEVVHDPNASCSRGLHIGTKQYARGFGSVQLLVEVNPRDLVSVPNGEGAKARVSRYRIIADVTNESEARPIREQAVVDDDAVCARCGRAECIYPLSE